MPSSDPIDIRRPQDPTYDRPKNDQVPGRTDRDHHPGLLTPGLLLSPPGLSDPVHHEIVAQLDPGGDDHRSDRLTLPRTVGLDPNPARGPEPQGQCREANLYPSAEMSTWNVSGCG